jgi:hypothetical protein
MGIAGTVAAGRAAADSLADVPPRDPGADLSARSARSKYVQIARIPEAGPGKRNVDLDDAINSKSPLRKLVGVITPADVHYERSHFGCARTKIVSRSTGEKGNIQPDRKSFIEQMGTNALFHYNAQQTWSIDGAGRVRNVLA